VEFGGIWWGKVAGIVFQGTAALSLDGKGRIAVPARHRDALEALSGNQLTLTQHPVGCLLVFPRPAWEEFRAKLLSLPMEADGWRRFFVSVLCFWFTSPRYFRILFYVLLVVKQHIVLITIQLK
jgi:hypothetical protein